MKFFNTAGPINPEKHYYVPLNIEDEEIISLIAQEKYFIIHAPRQTGKTTLLLELVKKINAQGKYKALYVNVEPAQVARDDYNEGIKIILSQFEEAIYGQINKAEKIPDWAQLIREMGGGNSLNIFFKRWSELSEKHLVIFIDEIDSLVGDTLISVLRQIRAGYYDRPEHFPQSIALVGVRDVRDYRIFSSEKNAVITGGSAFNIKAESLRISDFNIEQIQYLCAQHTQETGQKFTDETIKYIYYLTEGQPWLVNALCYQCTFKDIKDRSIEIKKPDMHKAKEILILRRDSHLDVLIERLREDRVRRVIEPMLTGGSFSEKIPDDIEYTRDLGLIKQERNGEIRISNPIYKEVLPRELSWIIQADIIEKQSLFINSDGTLNMDKLLSKFQEFFRENSEIWLEKFAYKEAGPHLLLMAFLQRIINFGGEIIREYGLGRKRVDLLIIFQNNKHAIELKVLRNERTKEEGLGQLKEYMDKSGATEGHLVIFDRSQKKWEEKIYKEKKKGVTIWGM